jgi:hypothetical protein
MDLPGHATRPLSVFRYHGWCAVCWICKTGVAMWCYDQPAALAVALNHYRMKHVVHYGERTFGESTPWDEDRVYVPQSKIVTVTP